MSDSEHQPRRFPFQPRSEAQSQKTILAEPANPDQREAEPATRPAYALLSVPEDGHLPNFKDQTREVRKSLTPQPPTPAEAIAQEEIHHHSGVVHMPIAEIQAVQLRDESTDNDPKDSPSPRQPKQKPWWAWPATVLMVVVVIAVTVAVIMTFGSDDSASEKEVAPSSTNGPVAPIPTFAPVTDATTTPVTTPPKQTCTRRTLITPRIQKGKYMGYGDF